MFRFAKAPTYLLISALLGSSFAAQADSFSALPEIGTTAASTLTIEKEMEYGDAYMRMLRASRPVISDPLLSEYLQDLGHRLVANAEDVRTPFNFFMIQNREINAFAFFGGHVAIHSGLFLHARTESELASVIAHEIAHVTQRHLARSMEDQAKKSPATMAALIGSLMLAIASLLGIKHQEGPPADQGAIIKCRVTTPLRLTLGELEVFVELFGGSPNLPALQHPTTAPLGKGRQQADQGQNQ